MQSARRPITSHVLLALVLTSALVLSSCNGFFVGGGALNSITVTPTSIFLKSGETKQFSASGTTVDGTTKDVSSSAKWTTSASGSATVNTTGLVTAGSTAGSATITASQDGVSATGSVIVNPQALSSLAITPSSPTVATGSTTQLKATGTFADNTTKDLTSQVAWTSGTTTVATVNSTGLVTGVAAGTSTITVTVTTTSGDITGTATLTVQ